MLPLMADGQYILCVYPDAYIASICATGSFDQDTDCDVSLLHPLTISRFRYDCPTTIFHHPSHVLPRISMKIRTVNDPGSVF